MQLGEISFCDQIGYNIKSDNIKKELLEKLENVYNFKVIQKHHRIFHTSMINDLNRIPHLVSVKTNGNPYLLYLTRYNFANQCIFIDKKIQHGYVLPRMIIMKIWFHDSLFNGTLIDGEMLKTTDGTWEFLMSDILAVEGKSLFEVDAVKRINILQNVLQHKYFEDDMSCCAMKTKKYFSYNDISYITDEFIPKLNYTCRGIYFKPLYKKYKDVLVNFDDSLIVSVKRQKMNDIKNTTFLTKEKDDVAIRKDREKEDTINTINTINRQDNNTIEDHHKIFFTHKTKMPDVYEIDVGDNKKEVACIPNLKSSKYMRQVFSDKTFLEGLSIKYELSEKFKKWIPVL